MRWRYDVVVAVLFLATAVARADEAGVVAIEADNVMFDWAVDPKTGGSSPRRRQLPKSSSSTPAWEALRAAGKCRRVPQN